jgi:hypothetical protein
LGDGIHENDNYHLAKRIFLVVLQKINLVDAMNDNPYARLGAYPEDLVEYQDLLQSAVLHG